MMSKSFQTQQSFRHDNKWFTFITVQVLLLLLKNTVATAGTIVDLSQTWVESSLYNKNVGYCNIEKEGYTIDDRVRGYTVIKDGIIVAESYSNKSTSPTELGTGWSTTKSWSTMLIGYLVDTEKLNINSTLGEIFNKTTDWINVTESIEKQSVTIREALTMTGGLLDGYPTSEIVMKPQTNVREVLSIIDYNETLRGTFQYMAAVHLVAQIIYRVSGMTPKQLAISSGIFPSLGIQDGIDYTWDTFGDIEGSAYGIYTHPRSMAKLGQLYLQKGLSAEGGGSKQLISESWIQVSTQNQLMDGHTTGEMNPLWHGYGYQWWVVIDGSGDATNISSSSLSNMYAAYGLFGQYIAVAPQLNMVVTTITVDNYIDTIGHDPRNLLLMAFNNVDNFDIEVQDNVSCIEIETSTDDKEETTNGSTTDTNNEETNGSTTDTSANADVTDDEKTTNGGSNTDTNDKEEEETNGDTTTDKNGDTTDTTTDVGDDTSSATTTTTTTTTSGGGGAVIMIMIVVASFVA